MSPDIDAAIRSRLEVNYDLTFLDTRFWQVFSEDVRQCHGQWNGVHDVNAWSKMRGVQIEPIEDLQKRHGRHFAHAAKVILKRSVRDIYVFGEIGESYPRHSHPFLQSLGNCLVSQMIH